MSFSLFGPHPLPIAPQITRASSHVFCLGFVLDLLVLARFDSRFFFRTFLSFGGILGKFWFCTFLFLVPSFANFWIFSKFENFSFWF